MGELAASWDRVEALLGEPNWDGAELTPALRALGEATARGSADERAEVVARVARAVGRFGPQEAGISAICGGTLVEHGAPAEGLLAAIRARLPEVLALARRFAARAAATFPDPSALDEEDEEQAVARSHVHWKGVALPADFVRQAASEDPAPVQAYATLAQWCLPTIAIATRDPAVRAALAADRALREAVAPLAEDQGEARFLHLLLRAPVREPLLAVDRRSGRVFLLEIDGVSVNFELHTLLAAALAGPLGHAPPPPEVVAALGAPRGVPCRTPSTGVWNLYAWPALGQGDEVPRSLWVWNEGAPDDVPRFEDVRVVVLDAPAYLRSWNTTRTFDALVPRVTLVRELPSAEARATVDRMRAAAAG